MRIGSRDVVEKDAVDCDISTLVAGPVGIRVNVLVDNFDITFGGGSVDVSQSSNIGKGIESLEACLEIGVRIVTGARARIGIDNDIVLNVRVFSYRIQERLPCGITGAWVDIEWDEQGHSGSRAEKDEESGKGKEEKLHG